MKTLLAVSDPMTRLLLQRQLQSAGCEIVSAFDGIQAWNILQEKNPPRFTVLGWGLPGMSGSEIVRKLREGAGVLYTYTILLTPESQKHQAMEGISAGADDYLVTPVDPDQLTARLIVAKRIVKLQDQLVTAAKQAAFIADHDGLTGMFNHNAIVKVLRREIARGSRSGSPTAVLMLDIDFFKKINDTYGHFVGDSVLEEVSGRISNAVRPYDTVGRFGGEEFVVVAPNCNRDEALALGERLRALIAAQPVHSGNVEVNVTISVGVALGLDKTETVLHAADTALYAAKHGGRNRVEIAAESETQAAEHS